MYSSVFVADRRKRAGELRVPAPVVIVVVIVTSPESSA
jgi:hypothetical protein